MITFAWLTLERKCSKMLDHSFLTSTERRLRDAKSAIGTKAERRLILLLFLAREKFHFHFNFYNITLAANQIGPEF